LEKSKDCYISAAVRAIVTKFGTQMQFDPLDNFDRFWNFKNPRWRRPPCWKIEKSPYLGRFWGWRHVFMDWISQNQRRRVYFVEFARCRYCHLRLHLVWRCNQISVVVDMGFNRKTRVDLLNMSCFVQWSECLRSCYQLINVLLSLNHGQNRTEQSISPLV